VGPLSSRHGASSGYEWREGFQIRRVAANILNKKSRTADKRLSSSLGVGREATLHYKNLTFYERFQSASDLD
jgi:hypothetical protein